MWKTSRKNNDTATKKGVISNFNRAYCYDCNKYIIMKEKLPPVEDVIPSKREPPRREEKYK